MAAVKSRMSSKECSSESVHWMRLDVLRVPFAVAGVEGSPWLALGLRHLPLPKKRSISHRRLCWKAGCPSMDAPDDASICWVGLVNAVRCCRLSGLMLRLD